RRRLFISPSRKRALSTLHTASSSIAVNTTASSLCTTASQVLCRRSRGPSSKAQETRYPVLIARRLREWAGIWSFAGGSYLLKPPPNGVPHISILRHGAPRCEEFGFGPPALFLRQGAVGCVEVGRDGVA